MAPPLEISIPTTSVSTSPPDGSSNSSSSSSKPYTLYNITLRLPLRSFVVQKRYSDFAALHRALTEQAGAPPPAPLPPKSWLRSTVSSPELTERRREGLERYLRAIAEPPDRRWRDTTAWRAFLNLPGGGGGGGASIISGVSAEARIRVPAIQPRDAAVAAASDPATWMDLHREMKEELRAANAALERGRSAGAGRGDAREAVEASTTARKALVRAGSLIQPLEEGLRVMRELKRLGEGEYTRRKGFVDAAKYERDLLDRLASEVRGRDGGADGVSGREGDREALLPAQRPPRRAVGRTIGAPLPETERTRELDNAGVLQLQKQQMEDQEEYLKQVEESLKTQKRLALAIGEQVEGDKERLDHMHAGVDALHRKLEIGNRRAKQL